MCNSFTGGGYRAVTLSIALPWSAFDSDESTAQIFHAALHRLYRHVATRRSWPQPPPPIDQLPPLGGTQPRRPRQLRLPRFKASSPGCPAPTGGAIDRELGPACQRVGHPLSQSVMNGRVVMAQETGDRPRDSR